MAEERGASRRPKRRFVYLGISLGLLVLLVIAYFLLVKDARGGATTCQVHCRPLQTDFVSIGYGRPYFPPGSHKARRTRFPQANIVHHGGCIPRLACKAWVRYCPECRKALRSPEEDPSPTGAGVAAGTDSGLDRDHLAIQGQRQVLHQAGRWRGCSLAEQGHR